METIEKTVNFLNMSIKTSMIDNEENEKKDKFKIVFIGTGVSTAVPNLGHVLNDTCVVCRDAYTQPGSKNKRNNVSIAIVFTGDDGKEKCVLIDVGKTMREACMSILPKHGIQQVSAIVLTHGHADAILGLDDVRDLQVCKIVTIDNPDAYLACQCCMAEEPIDGKSVNAVEIMAEESVDVILPLAVPANSLSDQGHSLNDMGHSLNDMSITSSSTDMNIPMENNQNTEINMDNENKNKNENKDEKNDGKKGFKSLKNRLNNEFCQVCDPKEPVEKTLTGFQVIGGAMPIYLNQDTMDVLKKTFSYLTDLPLYLDKNIFLLQRRIALLEFNIINNDDVFNLFGLNITSFPVYHGGKYVSLGFSIGKYSEFVYISDVKIIPIDTMIYLKTLNIKTLVIDAINKKGIWPHMGTEEALVVIKELKPQNAYFTGMGCQIGLHNDLEAELESNKDVSNVHYAYDGLVLDDFNA